METNKYATEIDSITTLFSNTFGGLNYEQLNRKPYKDTWSIGQVIEHIIVTNKTYFPVVKALKEGTYKTPFIGKIGFIVNFLGKFILQSLSPDRKKKIKTFPIWEPGISDVPANIIELFGKHQIELKQLIESCSTLNIQETVISSPANRNIVYTLESSFDIIIAHEKRHFEQAKEVLNSFT
jgi:hypothetical protein